MALTGAAYESHREMMKLRRQAERALAAEISPFPPIVDPERRAAGGESLRHFCEIYRSEAFTLCWSEDHIRIIDKIDSTVRYGGLFAHAMPRASGKTTITITAAVWALLYGYRHWVCLVGATAAKAESLLKSVKTLLRFNELLMDDFPEVCWAVRQLQGKANRVGSQTYQGQPTNCVWSMNELVMPTIKGSAASGGKISCCGITGDIRGQQETTSDGDVDRPDYAICDDPQTRESAYSRQQTTDRLAILNGDILGLAGPGIRISGVVPCTVISQGDLADQLLDKPSNPLWGGIRTQMITGWPKRTDLWDQYFEIRNADAMEDKDETDCTQFYVDNQVEMDEGVTANWEQRHLDSEASAVQHAMNLYGRDPGAFFAEYQNQPLIAQESSILGKLELKERVNVLKRREIPIDADCLTAMVDIQKDMLFYTVVAWKKDFTGHIVDYGGYPDQKTTNFTLERARYVFSKRWPNQSLEVHLQRGLTALIDGLMETVWERSDGAEMSIDRLMIDANWGQARDIVYSFVRNNSHRSRIYPAHGKYVGPESDPLNARHKSKYRGKTMGLNWRIAKPKDKPSMHLLYDVNFWKSFVHSRFATEPNTASSLTLFAPSRKNMHDTFAAHMVSEYATRVSGKNRELDIWRLRPDRPDNHWFD